MDDFTLKIFNEAMELDERKTSRSGYKDRVGDQLDQLMRHIIKYVAYKDSPKDLKFWVESDFPTKLVFIANYSRKGKLDKEDVISLMKKELTDKFIDDCKLEVDNEKKNGVLKYKRFELTPEMRQLCKSIYLDFAEEMGKCAESKKSFIAKDMVSIGREVLSKNGLNY